jgi:hypothetical protein
LIEQNVLSLRKRKGREPLIHVGRNVFIPIRMSNRLCGSKVDPFTVKAILVGLGYLELIDVGAITPVQNESGRKHEALLH